MDFKPRACQTRMMRAMIEHPRCNIWGPPGVGKTSATLAALDILWLCGSRFHPALVLAPLRVARDVWGAEAAKWKQLSHLRVVRVLGSPEARRAALAKSGDIYVTNYENAPWLVAELDKCWPFQIVVADEASLLKGFRLRGGGKRARALSRIAHRTGRWINLTGTPASNGLIDLWGMQWFVDGGAALGRTFTQFKSRWFIEDKYTHQITPTAVAKAQISARIAPTTCSLRAQDYFDLPPVLTIRLECALPASAYAQYYRMERKFLAEVASQEITAATAAAKSIKCVQMASGAVYGEDGEWIELHQAKLQVLGDLVEDMRGEPLLCAYHFKHDATRILQRFPDARKLESEQDFAAWNRGEVQLGLIHPASAGHGLNLGMGGRRIVFFTPWWDFERHQQVIDRLGPVRQAQLGRTEPVMVYYIAARSTLDDIILARLADKRDLVDLLLERYSDYGSSDS